MVISIVGTGKQAWILYKSKYPEPSISPVPIKVLFVVFLKTYVYACEPVWVYVDQRSKGAQRPELDIWSTGVNSLV